MCQTEVNSVIAAEQSFGEGSWDPFEPIETVSTYSIPPYIDPEGVLNGGVDVTVTTYTHAFLGQGSFQNVQPIGPTIGAAPPVVPRPVDNRPSCISVAWNAFEPDPVTGDAVGQTAQTCSQAMAQAGTIYAAAKGLTVPLRSPYFRAFADLSEFSGFVGEAAPVTFLAFDVLPAVFTSAKANLTGQCQNNFWSTVTLPPLP